MLFSWSGNDVYINYRIVLLYEKSEGTVMKDFYAIDMHCDTMTRLARSQMDFRSNDMHIDLSKLEKGNYMCQCFAIFLFKQRSEHIFDECNAYMDFFDKVMAENQDRIRQVTTAEEILRNAEEGRVGALLTIEEGAVIEGSLEKLEHFYNRGVRMMTLTWNFENEIAYPNYVYEKPARVDTERGLKSFGYECINRMWDLGMIVDVSHLNDAGIYDVLGCARKPIVASHSNARAVHNVPRNMTDDMIRKLAANGGMMGINYCPDFVSANTEENQIPALVEHVKHIVEIGGIETVGLGSDFDGIQTPNGMSDATKTHEFHQALLDAGFSREDLDKMFYKNFLRVLKANQAE